MSEMVERVARAIAIAHGDAWDAVPDDKQHWTRERGKFGGRFRDVNENFKDCYRDEARAAIEAMRKPTPAIEQMSMCNDLASNLWPAMIDEALK